MNICDILDVKSIRHSLRATTKEQLVEEITELLAESGKIADKSALLNALVEREKLSSTGVGKEVAIPHAKCDRATGMCVALGIAKEGIDFDAIDNQPVRIVFGVTGPPDDPETHLRILSHISRLMRNEKFKIALVQAQSADEILNAISEEEARVTGAEPEEAQPALQQDKLVILVLYDIDYIDEVLEYFVELGVGTGIVLEGTTLMEAMSRKIPLFADFAFGGRGERGHAKMIFGVARADMINALISGLEDIIGDLEDSDRAALFTMDIEHIKGSGQTE